MRLIVITAPFLGLLWGFFPARAQLDLPSMPGPPYPDPRGQNRWGVKFDPRKHGPPYDKRAGANRNFASVEEEKRLQYAELRPKVGRGRTRMRDAPWSPSRLRQWRRSSRGRRRDYERPRRPKTPPKSKPPKARRHYKPPSKEEHRQFWEKWNAWYFKQIDAKANPHKYKKPEMSQNHDGVTYLIDAEEFAKIRPEGDLEDDEEEDDRPRFPTGFKFYRDFYLGKARDLYGKARHLVGLEGQGKSSNVNEEVVGQEEEEKPWGIFTTIGKGMDAAHDAMGSVRKTVGGSILGMGVKYGGKMAMNAVMNVGTSALTTALTSATLG